MTQKLAEFSEEYKAALKEYLAGSGEVALQRAHELGRKALSKGISLVDVASLHWDALKEALEHARTLEAGIRTLETGSAFFEEAIMAFEMTTRGFREATETKANVVQFSATLSHELRTPLTSILASAGMLQELLNLDPKSYQGKLLANILSGATTLKTRTDDLMDMVGFHSGTLSVHPVLLDAGAYMKDLYQRLEPEVTRAGLQFVLNVQECPVAVVADPDRLTQVLVNLVHNAMKYAPDGSRIDLRASAKDGWFIVEVQDYGKGISLPDQKVLFQPYSRIRQPGREIPGLGIGLALCRQIAEAHGGHAMVESEVGKGSKFKLLIPLEGGLRERRNRDESTRYGR